MAEPLELADEYWGAINVESPSGRTKAIGLIVRPTSPPSADENDHLDCDVLVELFVNPPTLSVPRVAELHVNTHDLSVLITGQSGLAFHGSMARDGRRIEGTVSLGRFQLLDVDGEFNDRPIVFQAENAE